MSSSGITQFQGTSQLTMTALAGGAAPTLAANTLSGINAITTVASDNDSVILPAGQPKGTTIYVANLDAGQDATVFPPTGGTINGGTVTSGVITIGETQGAILVCASTDGLTWLALLGAVCVAA